MAVYKFKPLQNSIRADALFTRPILEWEHVNGRFFAMIRDALARKTNPSLAEFSVEPANILAEVRARYRLFGGAASIFIQSAPEVLEPMRRRLGVAHGALNVLVPQPSF